MFADSGLTFYLDWATDTMYDVYTSKLQEFMAGRIDASVMMQAIQDNWTKFQESRSN
jgi:hypothetical protein